MTTDYTILAEIKHLFQTRRLKSCLAKCEEELATLGAVRSLHDEFALFPTDVASTRLGTRYTSSSSWPRRTIA